MSETLVKGFLFPPFQMTTTTTTTTTATTATTAAANANNANADIDAGDHHKTRSQTQTQTRKSQLETNMPQRRRGFIDRSKSVTFQVVHRSRRDHDQDQDHDQLQQQLQQEQEQDLLQRDIKSKLVLREMLPSPNLMKKMHRHKMMDEHTVIQTRKELEEFIEHDGRDMNHHVEDEHVLYDEDDKGFKVTFLRILLCQTHKIFFC